MAQDELALEWLAAMEHVVGVEFSAAERELARGFVARVRAGFAGRRAASLPNPLSRALVFEAPGRPTAPDPKYRRVIASAAPDAAAPPRDDDLAFAPVSALSRWIERGQLSSRRLTELYLERLDRLGPKLNCVVTPTPERARAAADAADRELAAGRRRGPLHGIPWGAKDLLDTAGIATTWGAAPNRARVPDADAHVVRRLDEAGAVLVAKLSLGELAMGDVWFGGQTRNPWKPEEGSSGSSAGSAAAVAAGLVGFALGTETTGSIESPCKRCGAVGLRPTFGRVARAGAMQLCASLDKIGPICRSAEDTILVLEAIAGADAGDPSSRDAPLEFDARASIAGRRVGYLAAGFEAANDRAVLAALASAGATLRPIELPDLPYDALMLILFVEAAASFEDWMRDGRIGALAGQGAAGWPNLLRAAWYLPAVEYLQAERLRRRVIDVIEERFRELDALVAPSDDRQLMRITNHTGHPGLTLPSGFRDDGTPFGVTLYGRTFAEGPLVELGMALERELGLGARRPPGF